MVEVAGIDVTQYLYAAVALAVTYLAAKILQHAMRKVFERTPFPESIENGLVTLSSYTVYVVGILVALSLMGIDLTSVMVGIGAFSIATSFALSNVIQNFVSGLLVMADRVFKIGDEIKVQSYEGKVMKVSIRTTIIETEGGDLVSIPNSIFITNPVIRKKGAGAS